LPHEHFERERLRRRRIHFDRGHRLQRHPRANSVGEPRLGGQGQLVHGVGQRRLNLGDRKPDRAPAAQQWIE
jgi:hypothetical protein